ncbi:MAG: hypothetical protein ACOC0B_02155, partial [bacterium]
MIGGPGDSARTASQGVSPTGELVYPGLVRLAGMCAIVLSVTAIMIASTGAEIPGSVPSRFRLELLAVYGVATLCLFLAVAGVHKAAYAAIAAFAVLLSLLRITTGPASLVLVLTMVSVVLSAVFVPSTIGRRTVMLAAVLVAGFLPTPEYVFGETSSDWNI